MFLEHVNMTVSDLDRSIAFYERILGLRVRWSGSSSNGRRAAHVGDDRSYLALFQASADSSGSGTDYARPGINHFGFVVDRLDEVRDRLSAEGITPHLEGDYDPGTRLYFYDPDGIEVEVVEYEETAVSA